MDPLVILGRAKNESTQGCVYFKLLGEYQPSHGYSLTAEATDLKTVFIANINLQDILDRLDEGGISPSGIKELLGWISSSFQDSISTARRHHHHPSTQDDPSSLILSAKTKAGVNIDLPIAPIATDNNGQNISLLKWVTDDILSCLFGERDRLQMDLNVCREEFSTRERKMSDVLELLDKLKSGERVATHSEGEGPGEKKDEKEEEANGGGGGKKRERGEGDDEGQRNQGGGGTRGRGFRGPVRGAMRALRGSRALRGRLAGGSLTKLGK